MAQTLEMRIGLVERRVERIERRLELGSLEERLEQKASRFGALWEDWSHLPRQIGCAANAG